MHAGIGGRGGCTPKCNPEAPQNSSLAHATFFPVSTAKAAAACLVRDKQNRPLSFPALHRFIAPAHTRTHRHIHSTHAARAALLACVHAITAAWRSPCCAGGGAAQGGVPEPCPPAMPRAEPGGRGGVGGGQQPAPAPAHGRRLAAAAPHAGGHPGGRHQGWGE